MDYRWQLRSAVGWMELGLLADAMGEIDPLPRVVQEHPEVLDLRYHLLSRQSRWAEAFAVASLWVSSDPGEVSAWINRAYSARRRPGGGIREAVTLLEPANSVFALNAAVPFNLACYHAQLGNLPRAREYWLMALERGDGKELLRQALAEPDLEPLWHELPATIRSKPKSGFPGSTGMTAR